MKISEHSDFNGMISKDLTNIMIHQKNDYAMIVSSNIGGEKHYQGCGQNRVYSKIFLFISNFSRGQHSRPRFLCEHGPEPNEGLSI